MLWLKASINVAETARISLEEALNLNVEDFLAILTYVKWNNIEIEKSLKKNGKG